MSTVLDTVAFKSLAFYSAILALKMFAMVPLTAMNRFRKNAFANPEDLMNKKDKPVLNDPDVEGVRRAHQNDLENILPFFTVGFLYCTTLPNPGTANTLFMVYTISRVLHTLVYAIFPQQPSRFLTFAVGLGINIYMAISVAAFYA